ncbi:SDR family oxidoreductase [Streptomyces rimosus]|uniref:SDR family oxidoreductase n=1 Tax=Streptomyces rimosus TaxID=1927 RepID=UPI0004C24832|nr:SDR family oxidoreductase [Streptomyces rimosus]
MRDDAPAGVGRTALITGATRGVGLAIAHRLCADGFHVLLNYAHSEADAERALAQLRGLPGTATAVRGDVTDPVALSAVLDRAEEGLGRLDAFVHNVASLRPMDAAAPSSEGVHASLATTLDPMLHSVERLAGLMAHGDGRIVAVSSVGARRVVPKYVGLGVAKAALESLVRYLAVELAGRGITVNAVSAAKLDKGGPADPVTQALAGRSPSGRLTTPQDLADVVWLLCAREARCIQGQIVEVDSGLALRAP